MNDSSKETQYSKFIKLYFKSLSLYKKQVKLEQEIEKKLKDQNILRCAILQKEEDNNKKKGIVSTKEFVFTLSKGNDTYFELLDIGKLADNKHDQYHNKEFIYPKGYKSKRIYMHYANQEMKMTYMCEVLDDKMCICAEDGRKWEGQELWNDFLKCFLPNVDFKSIEHFFGLTYKPIQYRIEKMGDISVFNKYVPVDSRKTSKNSF